MRRQLRRTSSSAREPGRASPCRGLRSTDDTGVVRYGLYQGGTLVSSPSGTAGIVSGLSCGTNYTLGVDAVDAAGNHSGQALVMVATTACGDTQPPTAPTGLAASSVTQTALTLRWVAATDNVGVSGYNIYRGGTLLGTTTTLPIRSRD